MRWHGAPDVKSSTRLFVRARCVRGAWRPPGEGDRPKQTTAVLNPVAYRSASIVRKSECQSAEVRAPQRTSVFIMSPKGLLTVGMTQRHQSSMRVYKIINKSSSYLCVPTFLPLSRSLSLSEVGLSLSPRRILMKYLLKNRNTVVHNWHQLTQYLSYQT